MPIRSRVLLMLVLLGPATATAQDAISIAWPNVPGRMGYNALPAIPNLDPVPAVRGELELAATAQLSGLRAVDVSAAPYFRLTLPFRQVAALEVDGAPFEVWSTSRATQARLAARKRKGSAQGDLRIGAHFLVLEEGRRSPAFGLRLLVKSTTGNGVTSRRFTNAPGYLFDVLAGKDLWTLGRSRLRLLGRLGLLVWPVAPGQEDDALAYGATLRASLPRGAALDVEWRGYLGWRFDDRPSVLGLTARVPAGATDLQVTLNRGLSSDAPPLEFRAGIVRRFDMPRIAQARPAPPPAEPARPAPSGSGRLDPPADEP